MKLKRMRLAVIIFGALVAAGVRPTAAQEWTQWRGANRDGVVSDFNTPKSWPKALVRKWKVAAGGGYSSPLVAGGRVYLHARREEEETVSAYELSTGKVVWSAAYTAPFSKNQYAVKMGRGPNSTPVLAGGRLYTLGVSATLSAFDARTGALLWRKELGTPDTSKLFCGTAMSPVVERGLVIVHEGDDRGGRVVALEAATGKEKWAWQGDGPGYSSPIVAELAGARQVVTLTDKSVVGLAIESGKLLWKTPFADEWNENIVTPVLYKQTLILSGVRQGTRALAVSKAADGFAAREVWHNPRVAMYMSSPVLDGEHLYGMSSLRKGQYFCLNARTGEIVWATDGREGQQASVVSAGGVLLFLTDDGQLIVTNRSPKGFEPLARYAIADAAVWAHPAVFGKQILVKDEASLSLWSVE